MADATYRPLPLGSDKDGPEPGEAIKIKPSKQIAFRPPKELKETV